jgi:hypothetical protein
MSRLTDDVNSSITVKQIRLAIILVILKFVFVNDTWNLVIVLDQFVMLLPWFVISQLDRKTNFFNPIDKLIWTFDEVMFSV